MKRVLYALLYTFLSAGCVVMGYLVVLVIEREREAPCVERACAPDMLDCMCTHQDHVMRSLDYGTIMCACEDDGEPKP